MKKTIIQIIQMIAIIANQMIWKIVLTEIPNRILTIIIAKDNHSTRQKFNDNKNNRGSNDLGFHTFDLFYVS